MFRLASLLLIAGLLCSAQAQNSLTLTGVGGSSGPPNGFNFIQGYGGNFFNLVSTTTITAANLGPAAASRYIVASMCNNFAATNTTFSSVTIGGVSAAELDTSGTAGNSNDCSTFGAAVPTGATGNIVVTVSAVGGPTTFLGVAVYSKIGPSSNTPVSTTGVSAITSANPAWTMSPTVNSPGVFVGSQSILTNTFQGWNAGSNMILDYQPVTGGGTMAFGHSVTAGAPLTVTFPNPGTAFDAYYGSGVSFNL